MKSASRLFAVVLLVGLGLRLYLLLIPTAPFATKATEPTGDSPEYVRLAANLAQGHAFSQDSVPPFRPDLLRTPVYPLFLALPMAVFGSSLVWPLLLQLLLSLAAIWLTRELALELGLGPAASTLACLLLALSPNLVFYSVKLTTETLFLCLLLVTLLLINRFRVLQRRQELVAAGACCGLLILTRPIAVFFPVLLALYLLWLGTIEVATRRERQGLSRARPDASAPKDHPSSPAIRGAVIASAPLRAGNWRRGVGNSLVLLVCTSIVLAPWVVRNRRVSGSYTLSTAFDYNISEYTGALTLSAARSIPVSAARDSLAAEAQARYGPLDENDQASYWAAMAKVGRHQIFLQPLLAARIHAAGSVGGLLMPLSIRALRVFSGQNPVGGATGDAHVAQRTVQLTARGRFGRALAVIWRERLAKMPALALAILAYAILFHVTLLVAFVVSLFLKRSRRLLWLLLPILYFVLSTGPVGEARFRVPVEPFLCLFAAVALARSEKGGPPA